jgi:hypothetical protein
MRKVPAFATGLLMRLGPPDESFIGDLIEEYDTGRSRLWYWRQVLSAIVLSSMRVIGAHPARTLAAVATGWATTLFIFFISGDTVAVGLADWLWYVDRRSVSHVDMWPFALTALFVSYSVFGISAAVVVRVYRRNAGPMLIAYALSMLLALVASTAIIEILTLRILMVPVPHTLFYVVSVALPYYWWSGLVLAPLTILIVGALASPRRNLRRPDGVPAAG